MSHNITSTDNLFTVGQPAWHKLGNNLQAAPDPETALEMAGFGWEVISQPLRRVTAPAIASDNGSFTPEKTEDVHGFVSLVRSDNGEQLSVRPTKYDVLQPRELVEITRGIVEAGNATYETGGSTNGGRRVWMLLKLGKAVSVLRGDDEVNLNLLIATSYDASLGTHYRTTPVRVVCDNTLGLATGMAEANAGAARGAGGWKLDDGGIVIRHTRNQRELIKQAEAAIGLSHARFENSTMAWEMMARKELNADQLVAYLAEVVPDPKMPARFLNDEHEQRWEKNLDKARATRGEIEQLTVTGKGMDMESSRGTLWGAYNAVSEYADQHAAPGSKDRVSRMLDGEGRRLNDRAFKAAIEILNT